MRIPMIKNKYEQQFNLNLDKRLDSLINGKVEYQILAEIFINKRLKRKHLKTSLQEQCTIKITQLDKLKTTWQSSVNLISFENFLSVLSEYPKNDN